MATPLPMPTLPGVRFHTETLPVEEALPRMDIAAFCGIAASGPVGVPVPVEDVNTFRDLFGQDIELAFDPEAERADFSQLGQSVEAFFRNRGRRCWVLRLNDRSAAEGWATNTFVIPGLVEVDSGQPLRLKARSPGSWCDGFRLAAVASSERLRGEVLPASPGFQIRLDLSSPSLLESDLIRIAYVDGEMQGRVDAVEELEDGRSLVHLFAPSRLRRVESSDMAGLAGMVFVPTSTSVAEVPCMVDEDGMSLRIEVSGEVEGSDQLAAGSLLRLVFETSPVQTAYAVVERVEARREEVESPAGDSVDIRIESLFTELDEAAAPGELDPSGVLRLERLRFGLRVWQEDRLVGALDDLEFSPERERYWGNLPTDEALFEMEKGRLPSFSADTLAFEAKDFPRFPLAAIDEGRTKVIVLGMATTTNSERATGAFVPGGSPLERNGLGGFGNVKWADEALADLGVTAVLREAHHRKYVLDRALGGFYALMPFEEISMISLPDVTHRRWQAVEGREVARLGTPILIQEGRQLRWEEVESARTYEVREAYDVEFENAVRALEQTAAGVPIEPPGGCTAFTYYRVRARAENVPPGPWSATLRVLHAPGPFGACVAVALLEAPQVEVDVISEGLRRQATLSWTEITGAEAYQVQRSSDPFFTGLGFDKTIVGPLGAYTEDSVEETSYFRLRALRGSGTERGIGPWSNTVIVDGPPRAEGRELEATAAYEEESLLRVHAALTAFCAARGDLFAILSLPSHYEADDAEAFHNALRERLGEAASFAALYHPWLMTSSEDAEIQSVRSLPPDGAVAGLFASRARTRGAWVAPANEPLRAVVGLEPKLSTEDWEMLFAGQTNLVREDPRGFMPSSAFTLRRNDSFLRQINVRRLMILLRRLVLREGNRLVFQPNGIALRRRLHQQFTRILEDLYTRGAFAGETEAEAFQVVIDESLNPQESVDQGRLVVEIRVAPSRPLQFLTVRLIQEGLESLSIEES